MFVDLPFLMSKDLLQKIKITKFVWHVLTFSRWRNGSLHIRTCKPSSPQSSSSAIFDFDSNKHIFWLNSISLFPTIILVKFESQSKVESMARSSSDKFFGTELLKFWVHSYPCSSSACKNTYLFLILSKQLSKPWFFMFREEIWRWSNFERDFILLARSNNQFRNYKSNFTNFSVKYFKFICLFLARNILIG